MKLRNLAAVLSVPLLVAGGAVAAAGPALAGAPYSCTTSSFTGGCPASGSYSDPNIWGSDTYGGTVRNQIWGPVSGETSVMSANSLTDWQDVINVPAGNTSVTGWPDSQVTYTQGNDTPMSMSGITSLTSTLNLNMQSVTGASYDNGWDVWGGVTGNSSTNYQYEMMVWTNQQNRGTCGGATVLGTHAFGSQDFTLCWYGSSTDEFVWYLSDASGNPVNETNSSVDIYSMLQWMITNGYYPSNYGLNQLTVGSEVCSTGGNNQDITLTGWTITENGSGGGGQQTPAVGTTAASNVTSAGATLNGTVNPEGADAHYQFDYGTTANYGSSTSSADAGSGTSDVNESAAVTGLQPNTTYHYRIEATNSAGTNFGNDQTLTTPAAAGGVSYDSQGSGKVSNAASLSWTQTVSGTTPAVLAEVSVGNNPDTGMSASLKDNGTAMTLLKTVHAGNQADGFIDVFGLTSAPAGTNTFTASVTGGTPADLTGGSESFDGAGSFGTPASAFGNSTTPGVTGASGSNGIVAGFMATGTFITDASSGTSRFTVNGSPNDGAGNSAGSTIGDSGGNVTLGWDVQSDYWAAVAVDVQPGSGGGQQAPAAATNAATSVTSSGATLNGTVNPEGAATTYQFDYGTTTSYGSSVPSPAGSAGSGTGAVNENSALTGLSASTTYHYRIEATNSAGTTFGADQQFTTSAGAQAPAATTNAATSVTSSGATLNGSVNPESKSTTYQFDYGTTTSYGTSVPSPAGSAGSGSSAVNENFALTGLTASTTYHYRIEATNATGTTFGADQQFTTSAAGGTTVAYDATGPSSAGQKCANCSTLSWSHIVSGSNTALLAGVGVGTHSGSDGSCVVSVTDNGTAMTNLGKVHDNGLTSGFETVYGLAGAPAGANTVAVTVTGCSPLELTGGSESFNGVSQTAPFGTAVTAHGSSATPTVATTGSTTGDLIAGFAANGSAINSATSPSTSRYIANENDNSGAGNSAGATSAATGSAVTMKWSGQSDWWGAVALQVQHA